MQLGQVIFFSVLLGIVWLNKGRGSSNEDQYSIGGVLFFIIVIQAFGGALSGIFLFPLECSIVRTSSYFITKAMADMPKTLLLNALFGVIIYFKVGLRLDAGAFFKFLLVIFLVSTLTEGI